jgi:hypothetical protein
MTRPALVAVMTFLALLGPVLGQPWKGPLAVGIVAACHLGARCGSREVGR